MTSLTLDTHIYLAPVCSGHSINTHWVGESISVFISSISGSSPLIKLKIHGIRQYLLFAINSLLLHKGMFLALGCGNANIPNAQLSLLHRLKWYSLRTFLFKESAPESFHAGIPISPCTIPSLTIAHLSLSGSMSPVSGDNSQINRSILTPTTGPKWRERRWESGAAPP